MIKTIFVLGAGASKIAGAPLMRDFLDRAREILLTGKVEDVKSSFERVFRAIGSLQSVHSKSDLDIVNVESVFACLEMANILQKLPGHEPEEITALLKDMKFVISRTIEETLLFPFKWENYLYFRTPPPYDHFVALL